MALIAQELRGRRYGVAESDSVARGGCARMPAALQDNFMGADQACVHGYLRRPKVAVTVRALHMLVRVHGSNCFTELSQR